MTRHTSRNTTAANTPNNVTRLSGMTMLRLKKKFGSARSIPSATKSESFMVVERDGVVFRIDRRFSCPPFPFRRERALGG
jgi:hypothetical protein